MSEAPAGSTARRATSVAIWIVGSIAVLVFVVAPVLGVLLLWAWGRWGSE